jgi:hypothetical protein
MGKGIHPSGSTQLGRKGKGHTRIDNSNPRIKHIRGKCHFEVPVRFSTPASAYTADPALEEKVKFEFVVRFKHGKKLQMDGDLIFQFDQTPFILTSTSIDWLVIDQDAMTAQFKGQGMLNGSGNYHFWVWVTDGEIDTIRIKIWEENGDLLYDTFVELPLGGGSIIIHE